MRVQQEIHDINHIGEPWMIVGDFNIIMRPKEKKRGRALKIKSMGNNFILDCELEDVGYKGRKFKWNSNGVLEKLHRDIITIQ